MRALCGPDLPRSPRHAVRSGTHLRWRAPLVVLRLLLLPAYAFHHLQLAGHRSQDPQRRAGLRAWQQEADPAGEPDELCCSGTGDPIRLLHHPGEHMQYCDSVYGS